MATVTEPPAARPVDLMPGKRRSRKRLGTYSLTPEAHLLLEQTVLALRIAGAKVDKSSLIEALIRRSNTIAISGDVQTLRHWVDAELGRGVR